MKYPEWDYVFDDSQDAPMIDPIAISGLEPLFNKNEGYQTHTNPFAIYLINHYDKQINITTVLDWNPGEIKAFRIVAQMYGYILLKDAPCEWENSSYRDRLIQGTKFNIVMENTFKNKKVPDDLYKKMNSPEVIKEAKRRIKKIEGFHDNLVLANLKED
jgi:hypothetical protein